jgi:hypothetical protein
MDACFCVKQCWFGRVVLQHGEGGGGGGGIKPVLDGRMLSTLLRGDEPLPLRVCLCMPLETARGQRRVPCCDDALTCANGSVPVHPLQFRVICNSNVGCGAHSFDFDWNSQSPAAQCKAATKSRDEMNPHNTTLTHHPASHLAKSCIDSEQSARWPCATRTPAARLRAGSAAAVGRGEGWNGSAVGSTSKAVRPTASS